MDKAKAIEALEKYLSNEYSHVSTDERVEINNVREYIIDNLK